MTLQYHSRPKKKTNSSRLSGVVTPYQWSRGSAASWRIGFGPSGFLVAEGAGISVDVGKRLFRQLEDEWQGRVKSRRPLKK